MIDSKKPNKIITVDGLASSGKSTLSRLLAQSMEWDWMSSGVLYRGFAFLGDRENFQKIEDYLSCIDSKDWEVKLKPEKTLFFYKGENVTDSLYQGKVDELSSHLSANVLLRKKLIPIQRSFYDFDKGLILEGRDSGTVIFPEATLKVFLEAPEDIRAERRAKDRSQSEESVLKSQKERDYRDQTRDFAPVKKPENSLILSSQTSTPEEMVKQIQQEIKKRLQI